MSGRVFQAQDPVNIEKKKKVPGPGHYGRGIEINPMGNYPLSTISNSRASQWSPNKNRFLRMRPSETPAPGTYNPSDYSNGKYHLSTFRNGGTPTIVRPPMKRHSTMTKDDTPGPG